MSNSAFVAFSTPVSRHVTRIGRFVHHWTLSDHSRCSITAMRIISRQSVSFIKFKFWTNSAFCVVISFAESRILTERENPPLSAPLKIHTEITLLNLKIEEYAPGWSFPKPIPDAHAPAQGAPRYVIIKDHTEYILLLKKTRHHIQCRWRFLPKYKSINNVITK